ESAASGEYVVLAQQADGPIVYSTDSGDTRLATAGIRFESGPEEVVPPNGGYEATYSTTGNPVAMGMYAYSTESPVGFAPLVSPGFTMTLTSPSGVDLDVVEGCPCITFGSGWGYGTGLGDSRVIPGTYTLTVETQFSYEITVAPFAVYFARPA
ncbi:MAG TPA: hypothetical protein VI796_00750, partial [Candidatus Thermoplasmatota archaeon]|nr:hypothetical protein [Candidatus Thermoplasmatota archaeon]